jgi:hypothetical protein
MASTPDNYQSQGNLNAPPGYPTAPFIPGAGFNAGPQAGQPANIDKVVQGMVIMQGCGACGRAYPTGTEYLAHVQAHNESPFREGSDFGQREATI